MRYQQKTQATALNEIVPPRPVAAVSLLTYTLYCGLNFLLA